MTDQFDPRSNKATDNSDLTEQIVSLLQGIRFGSVEIVVHDGRIVQIDKHEKFRLKGSVTN
ncbi:MAG: YezD family protein [Gammaproteobacteria bacterium]